MTSTAHCNEIAGPLQEGGIFANREVFDAPARLRYNENSSVKHAEETPTAVPDVKKE
jgi:hypothetical protein